MGWRVLAGAATGLAVLATGYDAASSAPQPGAAVPAHEAGRAVYNFRCYFCHGYSGDARTLAATYLSPAPRDFTRATLQQLPPSLIATAVRDGRSGTAMKSFRGILSDTEIQAVADFVAAEFVRDKAPNTAYHTPQNGWPEHQRFAAAFPFARGEIALDMPAVQLDPAQQAGRRLFLGACISCHDRARVEDEGPAWAARPVSFPRMGFTPGQSNTPPPDAVSGASVYARYEVVPKVTGLSARERRGETLFQANCAFCHGADGSGKNWIGQFMEPKARDLRQYNVHTLPPERLRQVIREGLPGTSMPALPAWRAVLAPAEVDAVGAYVARVMFQPTAR